jgi:hypothetical protein
LVTDIETFSKHQRACINYSTKKIKETELQIYPSDFLFEDEILNQSFSIGKWKELSTLYHNDKSEVPFDLLSASFYLVSRYEEYLNFKEDEFGRYGHENSIAYKENFLQKPLINQWLAELRFMLEEKFPNLEFKKKEFTFLPTYDIDIAYSYRHKGFWRGLGGGFIDLFSGKIGALFHRTFSVLRLAKDPYDTFSFLDKLHNKNKLSPIYFFLVGAPGKLDKNLSIKSLAMEKLISTTAEKYDIGLHPSFQSNEHAEMIVEERKNLRLVAEKKIKKSRQHYIKFTLPETYENLIQLGFESEYSMGYGSTNGFRASTCTPFLWYNLSKEEATRLRVFPFCFMECNSKFEQNQTVEETKEEISNYIQRIRKVNGTFISIWHNFSLGSERQWKGWRKLYEFQIEQCRLEDKGLLEKVKNFFSK